MFPAYLDLSRLLRAAARCRNGQSDPAALAPHFDVKETSFALTPAPILVAQNSPIRVGLYFSCTTGPVYVTTATGAALLPQGLVIDVNHVEKLHIARDGALTQIAWNGFAGGGGGNLTVFELLWWKDR